MNTHSKTRVAVSIKYNYNKTCADYLDRAERDKTPKERGLDFRQARTVFLGTRPTRTVDRREYGVPRFITAGRLDDRMVVIVWTPRGCARRVSSMRKANERETKALSPHLA